MGEAIIKALLAKKIFRPSEVGIHEPDLSRLKKIRKKFKIQSFDSNTALVRHSQIILLAVKPQQMTAVLTEIGPHISPKHLVLSIAAGLDTAYFSRHLPAHTRLIRIMPNMGMMIGEGASALYATPAASPQNRALAMKIFSAGGHAVFVNREELLDTVTAISGSGPAFVFLFMQAFLEAGVALNLPQELGKELVTQTWVGAAKIAMSSPEPFSALIAQVASKGGTTEAGLDVLEQKGFRQMILETVTRAAQRAKELRCTS